jgi:polysaccharide pyruvyl transferase WcaK-like protein
MSLARAMSGAVAVVGVRYHTVVTALCVGTPVVSTGYGRKHAEVMRAFGLEQFVHTVEEFDVESVTEQIATVARDRAVLVPELTAHLRRVRARLLEQRPGLCEAIGLPRGRAPQPAAVRPEGAHA